MHVHILGIGGTFMAGVAVIAQQAGFTVTGTDEHLYPPMSNVLASAGISVTEGYANFRSQHTAPIDVVVVGNVLSRGNPAIEYLLDSGLPYFSGPEWLFQQVLSKRHVLAVAGTHGKTSTTSMLAWILQCAGLNPGFLIGGAPANFSSSARFTDADFFVIEADEYDTAFFDKRPKFLHYRPQTLILNNCEFDHADIYSDLAAIQQQFHYLVRSVPAKGRVIVNADDAHLPAVMARGCWSQQTSFSLLDQQAWHAVKHTPEASEFECFYRHESMGTVRWSQIGDYNMQNALAAAAAAFNVGVDAAVIMQGLSTYQGVAKRMETVVTTERITVLRDFAHHPTAIAAAIAAVKNKYSSGRVITMLELGSRTLQRHVDRKVLAQSLAAADLVFMLRSDEIHWSEQELTGFLGERLVWVDAVEQCVEWVVTSAEIGDNILLLSNKHFAGLVELLQQQFKQTRKVS
jgi:UDP-N-acetylmuramate: L-alanyl-gamma-D-glutamyl-meso-diaminopimelate ligase